MEGPIPIGDLTWWQWIIFLAPVALLIFAALWLLWLGRRPTFPKGTRLTESRGRFEVHTVSQYTDNHPNVSLKELAHVCALAVWATGTAWTRKINGEAWEEIKEVCVYFVDDAYFEAQPWTQIQTAAAFLVNTGASVGAGLPMAVIRASLVNEVLKTGEPVIHEMCHGLLRHYTKPDRDREHTDPAVWTAPGGKEAAQSVARVMFKEYRMFKSSPSTGAE